MARLARPRPARACDEGGFGLAEAVVAVVVFGIVALGAAAVLLNSLGLARSNDQRVVAANLATTQIETARSQRALDIPDGSVTREETVGSTTYTVRQTANYVPSSSDTSVCAGEGNQLAYKLVTVTVTWDDMGGVTPVRSDTLVALGLGVEGIDPSKGAAAVLVRDAANNPKPDVRVTLSPGNVVRDTGVDGCAVFVGLDAATSYVATAERQQHVGVDGRQALGSEPLVILPGEVTRTTLAYDAAGALHATLQAPPGFPIPPGMALTLSNGRFAPPERAFPDCSVVPGAPAGCVSGQPRAATSLFPGHYGVWAGTCAAAAPSPRTDLATVEPGAAAAVAVDLGGVDVQVSGASAGLRVFAHQPFDAGCPGGEVWELQGAGGNAFRSALPWGTWTISISEDGSVAPPGGAPTVTLTPSTPQASAVVPAGGS